MRHPTVIAFALAFAMHAAALLGLRLPQARIPSTKLEDYVEVALYSPPPTEPELSSQPADPETPVEEPPAEPPPEAEPPPPAAPPQPASIIEPTPPPPPRRDRAMQPASPRPPTAPPAIHPKPQPSSAGSSGPAGAGIQGGYQTVGSVSYIRRGRAVYPPEALRKKETGTVMLTLYINEFGSVDTVEVARSSGNPQLDAAAVAAERQSKFRPAVVNGRPVKAKARVPYTFEVR